MFEQQPLKIFSTTLKDVIENISAIKECELSDFQEEIIEAFDGYEYEDIDEITGFESWGDISKDGNYELCVKIDHEHAYELTVYITNKNNKLTVTNVL